MAEEGRIKPELGDIVRDEITGFRGVCIGRTTWLHGCDRIGVESQDLNEGKPQDIQWFDEYRIKVLDQGVYAFMKREDQESLPQTSTVRPPGGPRQDPKHVAPPKQ